MSEIQKRTEEAEEAELEEKLEAIEQERLRRAEEAKAAARVADLKRRVREAEALNKAEAEYGSSYVYGRDEGDKHHLAVVETAAGIIILKRPFPPVHKRFMESKKTDEDEFAYVKSSLVYPAVHELSAIIEERPFVLDRCVKAVCELAGIRFSEVLGK